MEYIIASAFTVANVLMVWLMFKSFLNKNIKKIAKIQSQSTIYEKIKPAIPFLPREQKKTQSRKHLKSQMIKIAMIDGMAYWIKDSKVFMTEISEDGFVDYGSAKPIDTMAMSKIELDKLSFIVDRLTEGNENDSSHSGH